MSKKQINKGGKPLECPILDAAATPIAPRLECCVFGCRNSSRDCVSFHQLPQDPDRRNQWLKLINRQDLAEKLGGHHVVCSTHFLPEQAHNGVLAEDVLPSLHLPTTRHPFIFGGSSGLLFVPVTVEPVTENDLSMEIKFEPEEPPTCTFIDPQPSETIKPPEQENSSFQVFQHKPQTGNTYQIPVVLPQPNISPILLSQLTGPNPPIIIPAPQMSRILTPINASLPFKIPNITPAILPAGLGLPVRLPNPDLPKVKKEVAPLRSISQRPEPTYMDYQRNTETQTNSAEALVRRATFSAVEHLNIPPIGGRLKEVGNRSVGSQTTPELVEVFVADIKRKLGKELDEAKTKLLEIENPYMDKIKFIRGCDKYLDEKIANFVKSHAYLFNKFEGKEYPEEFKIFALKLYLFNPKSYKFVEQFFDLPSKDTIKKFRMPVKSGINPNLMEPLKAKIDQLSIMGRQCVVCFDVMKLKKNLYYDVGVDYLCGLQEIDGVTGDHYAEYAALISVRGLFARWKQPISFALISEKGIHKEIQAWLHKTIETLFDMGLNIKALVTNPDEEFLEVPEEPYFEIKEGKIYHIIDFPELLKIARDELIQYDFHIGKSVVKWEHVLSVYDADKTQDLKVLSNLTDQHVRPDETSKNDVKMATQLFSSDMAAAMHFHVAAGMQNKEAKATVQFMKKMKDLYDFLYSRKLSDAYRSTVAQNKFFKETLEYLKTIQLKDKQGNVIDSKFVSGLIFTIKSIKSLAGDLKKSNVKYLLTKNLSNFKQFRNLSSQPTPIEFTRKFRRLFLSNILNNTKKSATGDDMMATLVKISEYVKADMEKKEGTDEPSNLNIGVNDYKISWPSNEYIAGYLLRKCVEKHTCETCVINICGYYRFEERSREIVIDTFKFYNEENVNKICKVRPPIQFIKLVNDMEAKFNEYYKSTDRKNENFGRIFYSMIEKDPIKLPCECFPKKFLRMLYVRLIIFTFVSQYKKLNKIKRWLFRKK